MLSAGRLGLRRGVAGVGGVQSTAGAHGALDYHFPEPKKAPAGVYKAESPGPDAGWQLPNRKEYGMTQAMVDEHANRKPAEANFGVHDLYPHPHGWEGNFMHFQHPQDARFPSWALDELRNKETANPHQPRAVNHALGYKFRQSLSLVGGTTVALYIVKNFLWAFVSAKAPTRDKLVKGVSEVDTSKVEQGHKGMLGVWRGKPVFIRHRSAKQMEAEAAVDVGSLRDPETPAQRGATGRPEWVVMIGVCTHLGCLPVAGEGEYGGYYCPCHGSHYDTAGRIRKGPAPLNLEIPEHEWKDDNLLVIGKL